MGKFRVNLCRYTRDSLKKLAQVASATSNDYLFLVNLIVSVRLSSKENSMRSNRGYVIDISQ